MTETTAPSEKQETSTIVSKILNVIAYPAAAVTGLWAARVSTHNAAYNTAKTLGAFDDILSTATPKSRGDIQELVSHKIDKAEYLKRSMESKTAYQVAADARMAEMGLNSFATKWKYMAKASKEGVVRAGLAGSGIALGAILSVADSKALGRLFDRHSTEKQQR